jgi:hypothetical protein
MLSSLTLSFSCFNLNLSSARQAFSLSVCTGDFTISIFLTSGLIVALTSTAVLTSAAALILTLTVVLISRILVLTVTAALALTAALTLAAPT